MEKFLRSNKFALIISIFLALILWLFVTGEEITRLTPSRIVWQEVPLRVENLNPEYVITDMPSSVDITLEGLPEAFEDLTIQEIDVYVDLAGREPGNHLIQVQVSPPRGLSVVLVEPEQVRISIEVYITEDFEVEVDLVGEPASGWALVEYTVEPEMVLVGAPESIFEEIARISLVIDITGMRLMDSVELTPLAYDEDGFRINGVVIDPNLITVRFEFERIVETEVNSVNNGS
jgi:YbbR domain-containing protein